MVHGTATLSQSTGMTPDDMKDLSITNYNNRGLRPLFHLNTMTSKLIGKRYGKWVVVSRTTRKRYFLCHCDCGTMQEVNLPTLYRGSSTRCRACSPHNGGRVAGGVAHGMTKTPTYESWRAAKARCFAKANNRYKSHGARGITMCSKWKDSFPAFFKDMGFRPEGRSLGRIDNDGDYEPSNCRWETPKQQANNRRPRRTKKELEFIKEINSQ